MKSLGVVVNSNVSRRCSKHKAAEDQSRLKFTEVCGITGSCPVAPAVRFPISK